jgi:transposase
MSLVRKKYQVLALLMDERMRRLWAASEAKALGWGGITVVAKATGLSRTTIHTGLHELEQAVEADGEALAARYRSRRPGGGRIRLSDRNPALVQALNGLIEPATRGDPESPLRWVSISTRHLAEELTEQGYGVSHVSVARLLHELDYSLQAPRKVREGESHPDRDAQFHYINQRVRAFQRRAQPVISVDTKKKELIGDFYNGGREWHPKGQAEEVRSHDFPDKTLGKVIPYGVYDLTINAGWVSVGIDHDTAEFAAETIERWWRKMGSVVYPQATRLLITADSGGSNSSRTRLWKVALQTLATRTRLQIQVCHYPPGTSKWNKIEHRMFCHITENWRGRPLISRAVVVNLIGNTTTQAGLRIEAELDTHTYATGIEVSDEQLAAVNLKRDLFHGDWNYKILPAKK